MTTHRDLLVTFAYACQRGTDSALVLDALERIYAVADATDDTRQSTYDFLCGFHAGLMQIEGAEVAADVSETFRTCRAVLWHAMMLYEADEGPAMDQVIRLAQVFCRQEFGVICDLRAGTAVLPTQPDQHVRDWRRYVHEANAAWTARLRGQGEPLNIHPDAARAVIEALEKPL